MKTPLASRYIFGWKNLVFFLFLLYDFQLTVSVGNNIPPQQSTQSVTWSPISD